MNDESPEEPKKINIPVFKLSSKILRENGASLADFIEVENLSMYGFTPELVSGFMEYEVFPQVWSWMGRLHVRRVEVFGLVRTMLDRSLSLYHAVEGADKAKEYILANAVPVAELEAQAEANEAPQDIAA